MLSKFFNSEIGVRQGEHLSPSLFALFLNDLEQFVSCQYNGLASLNQLFEDNDDQLVTFIKLFILLYADDTVILAEDAVQLQKALDAMCEYSNLYKLKINTSKTKVVIFSRGKVKKYPNFTLGNETLEVVGQYTYLGIVFNFNGLF